MPFILRIAARFDCVKPHDTYDLVSMQSRPYVFKGLRGTYCHGPIRPYKFMSNYTCKAFSKKLYLQSANKSNNIVSSYTTRNMLIRDEFSVMDSGNVT